jgi:hypothetical protein
MWARGKRRAIMSLRTKLALAGAAAAATAAVVVAAPSAGAAPANGLAFTLTCPAPVGTVTVTTPPGNGAFTPAFIAGTQQLFIPYQVTGEVTVGGEVVDAFNDVKKAPTPANAVTCTFVANFTEDGTAVTINGTVVAVLRGH